MLYEINVDIEEPEFGTPRTVERKIRGLIIMEDFDAYVDAYTDDIIERPGDRYLHILIDCSETAVEWLTQSIEDLDGVIALSHGETSHELHC